MAPFDLPRLALAPVLTIAEPGAVAYVERPSNQVHAYGRAHAFIGCVEDVRVIGMGSLVAEHGIYAHGVTSGNYENNLRVQLQGYPETPDGGSLEGEHVLIWGMNNFGHWLFTYLMRATLLYYKTELMNHRLLIRDDVPKRFVEWLKRMGFTRFSYAPDGVRVEKLWVPSVVTYRGHYDDMRPYVFPQALHLLRRLILKDLAMPHPVRERIYLSRNKAAWRKVENEREVVDALAARGIRRVYLEEHTLEQQLDLISRAEVIVCAAGGGSPMTMFAPLDCRIVELSIPQFSGTFASRCWAHMLGQEFVRINGRPTRRTGPMEIDFDYIVNVKELDERL